MSWWKCTDSPLRMRRLRTLVFAMALPALAACQPQPLAVEQMQASSAVYSQIESGAYLQHTIRVDDVSYDGDNQAMAPLFTDAAAALQSSLAEGGYLSPDGKALYSLSASIRDVGIPRCLLGYCENGAAVEYRLTDAVRGKVVYEELLVVPHTSEYPLFGADMTLVQRAALGGALGENYAHLLHVLSRKTRTDLQ